MIFKKSLLFLALLSVSTFTVGQAVSSNGGSIQGTITDPTGAVIPHATVTITSPDTGYTHTLTTDSAGLYSVGIPTKGILRYETSLKAGKFLLVVHGTADEVTRAKAIVSSAGASQAQEHMTESPVAALV